MFSPEAYRAAHESAVVHVRHARGRIRLTGRDRLTYLQGLLTNDVAALTAGSGMYAAILTPQGRMISDMRVFELGDAVLLDLPAAQTPRVASHLADFIFSEDAVVEDVSGTLAHLLVIGPGAAKALGTGPLRPFETRQMTSGGVEITVAGHDELGVTAFDVFAPAPAQEPLLRALAAAGVATIDDETVEVLRVEAGTPRFGVDMTEDTIPLEAGIEDRAISLTKGCYVGQEVIIRVLHRGQGRVARRLVGLVFPPDASPPSPGEPLRAGDRQVGAITSAAWSPALARPIALGYVHRDFASPGVDVRAAQAGLATVSALPFTATAAR